MIFIGQASSLSGVSVKAIRHYEKLGLLPNLGRSGLYRTFVKQDIDKIKLIKEAQKVGFKLSEFKHAFELNETGFWNEIEKMVRKKESEIKNQIAVLQGQQARLNQYSASILGCLEDDPYCSKPFIKHIP